MVQIASPEFEVLYGTAVRHYPLDEADPDAHFLANKGFLGKIYYSVGDAPPSLEPTVSSWSVIDVLLHCAFW